MTMSVWRYPRIVGLAGWIACFCFVYVASFFLRGVFAPGLGLDESWELVLEYAARHHLQFGKDIVFTYGPLGFLSTFHSQGHLLGARVLFAFLWSAVVATAATWLMRRMEGWVRCALLLWIIVFPFSPFEPIEDSAFFVMVYATCLLLDEDHKERWKWPVFVLVFVVLSLIKFTFLMAAVGSLAIIVGVRILQGRTREGFTLGVAACLGFLAVWLALGQALTNLPRWIRGSLEITSGFDAAMSIVPQVNVFRAALGALFLFVVALALILRRVPLNLHQAGILLTLMLYVFVAWKEGFVRADGHIFIFLWFLPLAFGFYYLREVSGPLAPRSRMVLTALYAGTIVLCLGAAHAQQRDSVTGHFSHLPMRLSYGLKSIDAVILGRAGSLYAARRNPDINRGSLLARAKGEVGDESVDVLGYLQWAALSSGMNYRPRPVVQGYSAYTPYLQDLNEAYFKGPNRPRFVLLCQQTIDGRFPTLDDSAAVNYVINNYTPIGRDGEFLVLEHIAAKNISFQLVHEQRLRYGEKLDVSPWAREPLFMSVSMHPSLSGRVTAFLFQPRPLAIIISRGTARERYRFVPVMAERPFLLSPVLNTNSDVLGLYAGTPWNPVQDVAFERPRHGSGQFQDTFTVRIYSAPGFLRSTRQASTR